MAVVIRLQGLPIVAGTMDIRHFFSGLTIPDGGVHIVGGEHGEAFIVFATDEDARLGMMRTGGSIKGSKVSLLLSSKTEMQNMIELSRRRFEAGAGGAEASASTAANRQAAAVPTIQSVAAGRGIGHGNPAFGNPPVTLTASSSQETPIHKVTPILPSMVPPGFPHGYGAAPAITTALASLNPGPPLMAPLPNMSSIPPMPTMATVPPPVSALPPVPTINQLPHGPPVPPMSHLSHMSSLPPFNPSMPPPGGLAAGLPLGAPNPMLFNPLAPLASLGLQAHMKAATAAVVGTSNPDEPYVFVQNLPFTCSEAEIRDFFRGLGIDAVNLFRDGQGRPTGRAMVKFFSPQDCFEALKRGGGMMGQRFVEIGPGSERQWASLNHGAMGMPSQNSGKPNSLLQDQHQRRNQPPEVGRDQRARSRSPHRQELCVYLKGLPYEADKKQIKEFFKNLSVVEDTMYIAYGPNGQATGEGFVEFKTEQDYKTALGAHMQYMGSRFIQVHRISYKRMLEKIDMIRKREAVQTDGKTADGLKSQRNCAHITNIPYNISRKDVRAFLEGIGLYEDTLKVLTDSHGNGLGQAVFQLQTEEDARKAERLHRQKLNGRDAFVHLVTFDQMKEIERNPPPQNKRGQRNQHQVQQNPSQNQHVQAQGVQQQPQQMLLPPPQQPPPHQPPHQPPPMNPFAGIGGEEFNFLRNTMGNLNASPFVPPFSAPGNGVTGPPPLPPLAVGLGEVNLTVAPPLIAGLPGAPLLEPPGFRPGAAIGGPAFGQDGLRGLVPFDNRKLSAVPQNRVCAGPNNGPGRQGGPPPVGPPPFNQGHEGLMPPPPGANSNPNSQRPPVAPIGAPTIVKLQNMPFTVTADEIMDFFHGYEVVPGSVCLQYNDKGLPNGEAMVAFQNPQEASTAVMELNDRPMGARKVKICLG
ncbi:RNA-binding protein 12 [Stigmatopora argus]